MQFFGHQYITRNLIVSFMDFFSRIQLEKYGTITVSGDTAFVSRKIIPVPICWSTREKWVEILRSSSARKAMDPAIREKNPVEMQWVLPRISCNLTGITYDSSRKLSKTQEIGAYITVPNSAGRQSIYTPVPYNLSLEIITIARNLDDSFQMLEQIVPYFSPGMSLNVFLFPDRESESIPIILDSVVTDLPTNIGENDERVFTNTFSFTLRANYYFKKPTDTNIILNIDANLVTDITINNINIQWLETQQKIQTRFDMYQATTNIPNPFLTTTTTTTAAPTTTTTTTTAAPLANFKPATYVIGQPDFTSNAINHGATGVVSNGFAFLFGNPAITNTGILYIPDVNNNRILGYNSIPISNDPTPNFVLGQTDFISNSAGVSSNTLWNPGTCCVSNGKLFVADRGNNRILIWNTSPTATSTPADVVVGQPDFTSRVVHTTQSGLWNPYGVMAVNNKLIISDKQNNRVLIWNTIPTTNGASADIVLGQINFVSAVASASNHNFNAPADVWSDGNKLLIVDTNNSRVLIWNTFPVSSNTPADLVLGQSDFIHKTYNDDNQDGIADTTPSNRTFSFPYNITSNGVQLFIGDTNNSRVLIWNTFPTTNFQPADIVLGQSDFIHNTHNDDNQDGIQDATPSQRTLAGGSGICVKNNLLFVSDTSNYRVLIFTI